MRAVKFIFTLFVALGLLAAHLQAQVSYTNITPSGTTTSTYCTAVSGNNVVGYYANSSNSVDFTGFLYNGSTYTTIAPAGSISSYCYGVSGNTVVGGYLDSSSVQHGLLYNGTTYTVIDPPGTTNSYCNAVSGSNVVGVYDDSGGTRHGFLYNGSTYTTIDPPGTNYTICNGVSGNNVVGQYRDSSSVLHGFLYNGTTYTVIDPPGTTNTYCSGVSGDNVVGYYKDSSSVSHGFLYNGTTYTVIDPPGDTYTYCNAVSGSNVVGYSEDDHAVNHGFLHSGTTYTTIEPPGITTDTYCGGVSGNTVVGFYEDSNNVAHSFSATVGASTGSAPTITSFTPTSGSPGTAVTINGTGFTAPIGVSFNGTTGTATLTSSTKISTKVPVGATTGLITVTASSGTVTSTGTFTVTAGPPVAAKITLSDLTQPYTGSPAPVTVTTTPADLSTSVTYSSTTYPASTTAPTNAGSYTATATITEAGYTGSAKGTLVISKATATVTLEDLTATYDGAAQAATATTTPSGLDVTFTYNRKATQPIAAGSYKVVGTVSSTDYTGTATGTLVIAKAAATVTLNPASLTGTYTGKALAVTGSTTPSGLPLTYAYTSLATDKTASPVAAGSYRVTATVDSANAAGSATGTLVISPAAATVTLGDLTQVYTGKPLSATATTVPARLPVSFTYDPGPGAPTAVGSYAVTGSITNPDYAGSATGTLQITPVPPLPVTGAATLITAQTATLNGTVNPKGSATRAWFHYYYVAGTNTFTATTGTFSAGNGNASVAFTEAITGLVPATVYHYQAIASNGISTVNGALKTFTTLAAPTFNNTTPQTPQLSASGVGVGISVNPNGVATKAYFLYGTNSGDLNLSTAQVSLGAGKTAVVASAFLPGLAPDTTYYYEVVTVSAAGTFTSQMFSFTTLGFDLSVVAVTGQAAPGSGGGGFSEFSAPAINTSDGVAFLASVSTSSNIGIWANQGTDTLALITQTGVTAPDTTATFASFSDVPLYNNANRVAFLGTISGTGVTSATNSGVWSSSTGTLRLIARAGDAAPGGSTFSNLVATALTGTNTVVVSYMAVTGSVTTANDEGIWEGTLEGNLAPVLRSGDTIGGHVLASPFVLASSQTLLQGQGRAFASNSGDVAIRGTFTDKSTGIVTSIGGTEALAYASGGIAPGTGTATFSAFSDPIINVNDHVAFEATLASGGGVTTANNAGIWAQDSTGTLQLIARTGTTTPGFIALSDPVTNSHDAVAFGGAFKSGSSSVVALYCNSTGTLTNFAQTGQQAPGCAPGVKFSAFTLLALPDAGGATGDGGIVFEATLTGTGVSAANNTGIWAVDSTGTPQLIVRTGDTLNVASSGTPVYETVSGIFFSGFNGVNAGQALGLADNGDIAFALTFTDKSGGVFAVQFP
jgi:hypothetical protein